MDDNLLSDRVIKALMASGLKDPEACARWVRSVKGTVTSKSFQALLEATGSFDLAVIWLVKMAPRMPRDAKQIERFHVSVRTTGSEKPRKTTVSMDNELYRALVDRLGDPKKANVWIATTCKTIDPAGGSLSRSLQAEIVRLVSRSS